MHYWNRDNFEGLDAVAEEAKASTIPSGFALYCRLRAAGQRGKALDALRGFLVEAQSLSLEERKRISWWLLEAQVRSPMVHQLLPHPLLKGLIEPTVEACIAKWPGDAAAHRWQGFVSGDSDSLRLALRIDPEDWLARSQLASKLLASAEFSTHHLVESQFLGEEAQTALELEEVADHISKLPDGSLRRELQSRLSDQRMLLSDWSEYKLDPHRTFPEWCTERRKSHVWPSIVYYENSSDA
jgi:hypothetical protein